MPSLPTEIDKRTFLKTKSKHSRSKKNSQLWEPKKKKKNLYYYSLLRRKYNDITPRLVAFI